MMKHPEIDHVVVDEANERTYVVRADRPLSDGEIYSRIRREILRRGHPLAKGESVTLKTAQSPIR